MNKASALSLLERCTTPHVHVRITHAHVPVETIHIRTYFVMYMYGTWTYWIHRHWQIQSHTHTHRWQTAGRRSIAADTTSTTTVSGIKYYVSVTFRLKSINGWKTHYNLFLRSNHVMPNHVRVVIAGMFIKKPQHVHVVHVTTLNECMWPPTCVHGA